ncbi:hypothetical protein CBS63078_8839 [Aspergillus niger]|nr:hypothetical protein CBS133816_7418 [Aspergillus niger]KAI2833969.1 hypothetical protein CBS11350_11069 [Aspergillus niger]KAI2863295.1 hypothetical protein CBS12448_4090 [Aspergillus niger]KAI2876623.1 hypothetical protein CBS13152_9581 [Aspergillus niger]KAI2894371.1 hypothetical protein CBS63078_8839 [Aspergillus niger]
MEPSAALLSSALGEGETNRVGDHTTQLDAEAEAEMTAKMQHRKIQNRKNQRARRLRIKEQDPGSSTQTSRPSLPFQVRRWRLDEPDVCPSQDNAVASEGATAMYSSPARSHVHASTSMSTPERAGVHPGPSHTLVHDQPSLTVPPIIFPLSTDHLLHLVQYNVFRAFVSNKRTLNTLLTGWTDNPPSPTTCPISGPYRDDTSVYPLNPNLPVSLVPTRLQQTHLHSVWINLFPFPRLRDNLIRREGSFDHWELLQDLIGELMSATPPRKHRLTPLTITVSDPKPTWALPRCEGDDEGEVTAGHKGLIVWGEPYDMQNWEATPGFLAKWSWAVDGCHDLVECSNRWRRMRGEEPIRLAESLEGSWPGRCRLAT